MLPRISTEISIAFDKRSNGLDKGALRVFWLDFQTVGVCEKINFIRSGERAYR